MCACVYVCVVVWLDRGVKPRLYERMHIFKLVCDYMHVHVCACVREYVYACATCIYVCIYVCMYV